MTVQANRGTVSSGEALCRATRYALRVATATWLFVMTATALAAPHCTVSATAINFGSYDVFDSSPNDDGHGTIQVNCKGSAASIPVALSPGQSNTYALREMDNGTDTLTYNLYIDPARTMIWGDGTGGSSVTTLGGKSDTTLQIYGRIPAMQDATVGNYSDNITITVIF
jgi:spore coat protein U-like protein